MRESWRPNITEIFWPRSYGRQRFVLSRSPWLLNRSTGFPYYISSTSSTLLACLHWLVELNSPELNSSALYYLQTPTRWYGHASTTTSDIWGPECVTSRILWNGLCDRHRAEITVIQFRGHSLPCVSLWEYNGIFFYLVPISSANFRPRDFLSWLPPECVTSFRCFTLNGIFGQVNRSKHNIYKRKEIELVKEGENISYLLR